MSLQKTGQSSDKHVFIQLFIWVSKYWPTYVILVFIIVASSIIPVLWAESMRQVFNAASAASLHQLQHAALLLGLVFILEVSSETLKSWITQKLSNRSMLEIQKTILTQLFFVRIARFARWHTGEKLQRLDDSAVEMQNGMNQRIPFFIGQMLEIILLLIYLTKISAEMMAGALAVGLLLPLLSNLFGKAIYSWQTRKNDAQASQDSCLLDIIHGNEVIRTYNLKKYFLNKWSLLIDKARKASLRLYSWQLGSEWSGWFGFWLGQIYILFVGALWVSSGRVEIGAIAAFIISYERLVFPLGGLVNQWAVIQNTLAHGRRVFEIADLNKPAHKFEPMIVEKSSGDIYLKNVSFSYDSETPVIQNFSFVFPKGQTTAIVGPSGEGKSTLLKLMLHLYEPDSGEIYIGNKKLHEVVNYLRKKSAYVPQRPFFFEGTIFENIAMGLKNVSKEDIINACKLANADSFIRDLPNSYETIILDGGNNFSGGEQQRLSIARAYLRKPELLFLDEPTSSLDKNNESLVQHSIKQLMKDRTVIIVSHQLSTIQDADQIVYLEKGQVLESGTHEELLSKGGSYLGLLKVNRGG